MSEHICNVCNQKHYSNPAPAIIVLVRKENQLLLVKGLPPKKHHTCVAGFIENGETAEDAVAREVFEETSIKVKNIQYFGSQFWPHPNHLMLGFTAEYESGEIKVNLGELTDAQWFDAIDGLEMPKPESIAYKMIMKFKN